MRRRSFNSRKSAAHPNVGTRGIHKSGYQDGYALGYRLGKEDSRSSFDGPSIIIPTSLPNEDIIGTIQRIEAITPHPYEILVANAGSSETTRRYLHERIGVVRHITSKNEEGISRVLSKAALVANGERLIILAGILPNTDHWINTLMVELERDASTKTIYVSTSTDGDTHPRLNICCLLFRKELLSEIGLWDERLPTLKECLSEWLGRIPEQHRIMVEASNGFTW